MTLATGDLVAITLTLKLALTTTLVLLVIATPLAWWLTHTRARWRNAVTALVALPLSWMAVPYLRTRRENEIAARREHLNLPGVGPVM